jgi:hypothetical protein
MGAWWPSRSSKPLSARLRVEVCSIRTLSAKCSYGRMKKKAIKETSCKRKQETRAAIAGILELQKRCILNPPGKPRLTIKDLINEGRP